MKKTLAAGLAAVFVAAAAAVQANLIEDGDFEDTGRAAWGGWDGSMTVDYDSTAEAHGGLEALVMTWTASVPEWDSAVASQVVPVTPGEEWLAEAYVKITVPLNNAYAYLETIFKDAGDAEVGKQQSAWLSGAGDWTRITTSGIVSNNAASATVQLVALPWAGGSSSGTVYWDDVWASTIPEPATCVMLGIGLAGILAVRRRRR